MSELQVVVDRDDRENPGRGQLLALHELRRRVEQLAQPRSAIWRQALAVKTGELERELHELIAALDRRVPRVEHAGEAAIARDAAALRDKAVRRLAELTAEKAASARR